MSEDRVPFLSNPHRLAFLDDSYHFIAHLADCLCAVLDRCGQAEETRLINTFRQRIADLDILDCECYGLSAADEIRITLSHNNTKALGWASTWIALGITVPADPRDPASVLDKMFWPVSTLCGNPA
jgi:hypothetical protein